MIRLLLYLLVLLALFLSLVFGLQKCKADRIERSGRKDGRAMVETIPTTDTVRVPQVKPIQSALPIVVPPRVKVSDAKDTMYRFKVQKGTIIAGIEKRKPKRKGFFRRRQGTDSLIVQTIDPKGIITEAQYPWRWVEMAGNFTVDSAGRIHTDPVLSEQAQAKTIRRERRKRRWQRIGTVAAVSWTFVLGVLIAR